MDKIKIMISSRCVDVIKFPDKNITFSELREKVKEEMEKIIFLGKKPFEILISEKFDATFQYDSYEMCLEKIKESDLVIVLYSGFSGSGTKYDSSLGICHAEYSVAFNSFPNKTKLFYLKDLDIDYKGSTSLIAQERDKSFLDELTTKNRFRKTISNKPTSTEFIDYFISEFKSEIYELVMKLFKQGKNEAAKSNFSYGTSLDWNKLSYQERASKIKEILELSNKSLALKNIKVIVNCIPDNMNDSNAREMTGKPFLEDHNKLNRSDVGIIHLIGVYKNATESQIKSFIGHPDIMIITEAFGFYVWERVNHIQAIFLTGCRDNATTSIQFERFQRWAEQSGEIKNIEERAKKRGNIVKIIKSNL